MTQVSREGSQENDATVLRDAESVLTVAAHFQDLKAAATELARSYVARGRGYFQPSEEEPVRYLAYSYWQARCALIEVVTTSRERWQLSKSPGDFVFLVAFSGALVLIDAARFLRDNFHSHPLIREKLNEPEPNLRIPRGVYDTVQLSLTSPLLIWRLYHALAYWHEHQSTYREMSSSHPNVGKMLSIVDGLLPTLQVTMQAYAAARLRVRSRQACTILRHDILYRAIYGLQKFAGEAVANIYVRPGHRPGLPASIVSNLRQLLQPGDVILSRREYALTNYFLPGHWPHAALYLGDVAEIKNRGLASHASLQHRWQKLIECDSVEPRRVLEAMKDGVLIRSLRSPCETDSVVVLRPSLPSDQISEAIARAVTHEGKPYDFSFDFTRSDRLVCTEVVYRAYQGIGGVSFELSRRAGRMTLSAGDLLQMAMEKRHFVLAGVYTQETGDQILLEDCAERVVRSVMAGSK